MDFDNWKRVKRKALVDKEFLKVYSDSVLLPDGTLIDDYSVVSLKDGVVIVATDEEGKLLMQYEYKYAADKTIITLPGGGIDNGKTPLEAAAQELLEETGYVAESLEVTKVLYEFPSKLDHLTYIVRAKNAHKKQEVAHESTEMISPVILLSPGDERFKSIDTTYTIAALAVAAPEFITT